MRIPLSGYAADVGKRDSPLLWADFWLEEKLGIGEAGLVIAAVTGGLLVCSILAFRLWEHAVTICLAVAVAVGAATSVAAAAFDVHRAALARDTFLPADVRWVDHSHLGPTTVLVAPGADPPVVSAHLFWNTSLQHLALLDGATRVDAFRSERAVIGTDGGITVGEHPLRGPILVEEYATTAQLRGAELVGRTHGTSLWRPNPRARFALVAEGRYLDGWLAMGARIRTWPGAGRSRVVLTLSLPHDVPAGRVELDGGSVHHLIVVRPGERRRVLLAVDLRRPTWTVRCAGALQVGNRIVCAKASVPHLVSDQTTSG
jgi:hypothetical protein